MGKKTDDKPAGDMPLGPVDPPAAKESASTIDAVTALAVPAVSKDEQILLDAGWVKEPKGEMWQCRQPFSTQGPGQVEAIAHGCRRTLEEALKLEAKRPK